MAVAHQLAALLFVSLLRPLLGLMQDVSSSRPTRRKFKLQNASSSFGHARRRWRHRGDPAAHKTASPEKAHRRHHGKSIAHAAKAPGHPKSLTSGKVARHRKWCPPIKNMHVYETCNSPAKAKLPFDLETCKAVCDADKECHSFQVRGGSCQFCGNTGALVRPQDGVVIYSKICEFTVVHPEQPSSMDHKENLNWCTGKEDTHVSGKCGEVSSSPREDMTDVETCLAKCDKTPTCRSVQVRNHKCQYCTNEGDKIRSEPGNTLYARLCEEDEIEEDDDEKKEDKQHDAQAEDAEEEFGWCLAQSDTHVAGPCGESPSLPRERAKDVDVCMAKCAGDATCRSVQFRDGKCQYCSNTGAATRHEEGNTLYTRLCTDKEGVNTSGRSSTTSSSPAKASTTASPAKTSTTASGTSSSAPKRTTSSSPAKASTTASPARTSTTASGTSSSASKRTTSQSPAKASTTASPAKTSTTASGTSSSASKRDASAEAAAASKTGAEVPRTPHVTPSGFVVALMLLGPFAVILAVVVAFYYEFIEF